MSALAFTLACALPVLLAWRIGNRRIDNTDYELLPPPMQCAAPVASIASQHVGRPCSRDAGGAYLEETRAPAVRTRRAA